MSDHTFKTTRSKARKRYTCNACREGILPGQVYARNAGISDGRFWSESLCLRCDALSDHWWCNFAGDGRDIFGDWLDDFEWYDWPPEVVALSFAIWSDFVER